MSKPAEYFTGKLADTLPKFCFGISILGAILSIFLLLTGSLKFHFFGSYLVSFMYVATLSLGALFIVIIFHLTRAGWSVVLRRLVEHIMQNIWLIALLFIPILFGIDELYKWARPEIVAKDHLIAGKTGYLNEPFFLIRSAIYFLVWAVLSAGFFKRSVKQDDTGETRLTILSQKRATVGVLLYALTISFAAFDWIMSITPHWYSTIFGIYIFAGSVVSALCLTSVLILVFRKYDILTSSITIEHIHDMGKLIYGFVIFWAYIGFSQYFLIWYANIPEETEWYLMRGHGVWADVSLFLAIGHFAIPFFFFMSRHMKRNVTVHLVMALWILFMHLVDIYWMIMPKFQKKFNLMAGDVTLLITLVSLFLGVLFWRMKKHSLLAHKDPRLEASLKFENM